MPLQPGDIEKVLNSYKETRKLLSPLIDFVAGRMLRDIDFETSRLFDDDDEAIAIQVESKRNVIPTLFLFWLEDDRFSLFIEDKEVIDDYVKDESDVEKTLRCTEVILTNEIHRIRFARGGKTRKVIYTYSAVKENGTIEKYEDESVLGLTMPWHKNEKTEHLFEAWIPKS